MAPDRKDSTGSVGSADGGRRFSWAEQLDRRLDLEGSVVLDPRQLRTLFASLTSEEEEALMEDADAVAAADQDQESDEDKTSLSGSSRSDDDDGGAESRDECESESGPSDASSVCLDGLFADLQRFKAERGNLIMSTSHPLFVSIMDQLSDMGMEERLKKRYHDQLRSLKDFAEEHGHCRVPVEHPTLGKWARSQRSHYDRFKKRLPGPLTKRRFARLERIAGFDDFDPSFEEREDGAVAEKAPEGEAASPRQGLTLDEKIRLKKAARKVKLMASAAKAFSSSKKLPGKEAVAAEMKKKRALLQGQRSLQLEGLEDSLAWSDASKLTATEKGANKKDANEHSEGSDLAVALQLAAEEKGANERGGGSDPVVALHKVELEKLRRQVHTELDAAADTYWEKQGNASELSHSFSISVDSMATKDRPENNMSRSAFASGWAVDQAMGGGGPSGRSSPARLAEAATEDHGSSYRSWLDLMRNPDANAIADAVAVANKSEARQRRPKGGRLRSASVTFGAAGGVAFDGRLRRTLDRGQSMPVRSGDSYGSSPDRTRDAAAKGHEKEARRRSKGGYLRSASMTGGSTFEERLRRKMDGESLGDIYQDPSYRATG